jgi:hypothetical protein
MAALLIVYDPAAAVKFEVTANNIPARWTPILVSSINRPLIEKRNKGNE